MRGRFITLEGLDGAGKSTHVRWLAKRLRQRGVRVVLTREPGGTPAGEKLRWLMLTGSRRLHPETETLLMFAARREHLDKVVLPALRRGDWVVCDRFTDATYAYQSAGSGVEWKKVAVLEQWVHRGLRPDMTLLFDVSPDVGRRRLGVRAGRDRFERERRDFHGRVRRGYLKRARMDRRRFRVIDARRPVASVQKELEQIISSLS